MMLLLLQYIMYTQPWTYLKAAQQQACQQHLDNVTQLERHVHVAGSISEASYISQ